MTILDWVEDLTESVWNVCRTLKLSVLEWKNIVENEKSVDGKPCK